VVALATSGDPFSLQTLTERLTIDGQTSVSTYDAAMRTLTTTSAAGRTSIAVLDSQGRVLGAQMADFAHASYSYDARGRLTSIGQGEGDEARGAAMGYDEEQGALRMTDALSRTQQLRFDSSGRPSLAILPGDRRVGFGYDGRGNLTAITPPGRALHSVEYTVTGLPSAYLPPRLGDQDQPATQTYDSDGQLTTFTRPGGQAVNFGYDNVGRLRRVTLARGEIAAIHDPTTSYLTSLSAPGNLKLAYSYDGMLPTGETWSGPIAGQVGWVYDDRLRVASQSVGDDSVAFAYDADDLLILAGDLTLSRDPKRGLVTSATLGSVASAWEYNPFGEPISYRATAGEQELYAVRYDYDKLGRITQVDETIGGETHSYGYTYDEADWLAEVRRDEQLTHSYGYDANGNRLSATTPESTISGAYDAQDRLIQYGDASYAYTASGELLSRTLGGQTTGYQYDELGNLLTVALPDGSKIEYLVDGRGRRVGKQVNGALVQGWLYQDGLRPVAELDGAGNLVSRFVYASGRNVPDYMVKGGATYRILTDHLGSPRLVVDAASGAVAQRMDYDSFGNILQDTSPGFQPFGFAGGLYDRDSGLVRFGARDYDAQVGRWTAKDPIGFAGGDTNLYGYVLNDPINNTDVTGLVQRIISAFRVCVPVSRQCRTT
jgi:RHS repeat-associated protein